jgi:transcription elongation factor GreB
VSKAFTSEETPDLGPVVRPPPRLAPGEVRYVTPEGQAALRRALEALRAERAAAAGGTDARGAAGADSQWAAGAARDRTARLADLDARAAALEGTLAALTILSPTAAPPGVVAFGRWVEVEDGDGRRSAFRLVGPDEVDARRGLISVHAPVARALLGKEAGDEAEVALPGRRRTVTIRSVADAPPEVDPHPP